jgi:hypothetical protein
MNVTESCMVNELLAWLLQLEGLPGSRPVAESRAKVCAQYLAGRAHRTLSAGVTDRKVFDEWRAPLFDRGR